MSAVQKTTRLFLLSLLALFLVPPAVVASPSRATVPDDFAARYEDARKAFEKGDFRRAQYLAEALLKDSLEKDALSPQLFQLMGHTRYRQDDLGRAALWYMRAALFPPPSPEIVQNLSHIRGRTGNLAFASNPFADQYSSLLTRPQWMRIVVVSAWCLIFSAVLFFVFRSTALRTLLMVVALFAVVAGSLGFLGWKLRPTYERVRDLAIVTAPNTQSYTAATTTAGKVIPLPPGSQVHKLESRGAWTYIETWRDDSTPGTGQMYRGWVQTVALSDFWPFDPKFLD